MAKGYLASEFINSVVVRAMLPKTQNAISDDDILMFANEEMDNAIVPLILQHQEDYLLSDEMTPILQSVTRYPIPYRAVGSKLSDVSYVDASNSVYEMTRVTIGDEAIFRNSYTTYNNRSYIKQFYVEGDEIVLATSNPEGLVASGNLKFSYFMRPNSLVKSTRTASIVAINTTTGDITFTSLPSNITTSVKADLIKNRTPYKTLAYDITINSITVNSPTETVVNIDPSLIPQRLAVGDYFCQAEETPVLQIPSEMHSILTQRVAIRCLEALGDTQGLTNAMAKLVEMETKISAVIGDRVDNAPKKIRNNHGFLQNKRYPFTRW